MTDEKAQEIIEKLDLVLDILGHGKGKLPSEIKREAQATILKLASRRRKRGHVSEEKGSG